MKIFGCLFSWVSVHIYSCCVVLASVLPIVTPQPLHFRLADKLVHGFMYVGLAFLVRNVLFIRGQSNSFIISVTYASLFGLLMEIVQIFIPYRSFELLDIAANVLGACCGASIAYIGGHDAA